MSKKKRKLGPPKDFFTVKLKPISKDTKRKLEKAAEEANKKIARNNAIYKSSNAHSHEHPVG